MKPFNIKAVSDSYKQMHLNEQNAVKERQLQEAMSVKERYAEEAAHVKSIVKSIADHVGYCISYVKKSQKNDPSHYNLQDLKRISDVLESIHDELAAKTDRYKRMEEMELKTMGPATVSEEVEELAEKANDETKAKEKSKEDPDSTDKKKKEKDTKIKTPEPEGPEDEVDPGERGIDRIKANGKRTAEISKIKTESTDMEDNKTQDTVDELLSGMDAIFEKTKADQTKGATPPQPNHNEEEPKKGKDFIAKHNVKVTDEKDTQKGHDSTVKNMKQAPKRGDEDRSGDKKVVKPVTKESSDALIDKVRQVMMDGATFSDVAKTIKGEK